MGLWYRSKRYSGRSYLGNDFVVTLAHYFYNRSEDWFAGPEDISVQLGISFIFLDFQLQSEIF